jgi:hypothetical protein
VSAKAKRLWAGWLAFLLLLAVASFLVAAVPDVVVALVSALTGWEFGRLFPRLSAPGVDEEGGSSA